MTPRFAPASAALALVILLSSCASVSTRDLKEAKSIQPSKPTVLYLRPFQTEKAEFRVDREGMELSEFKKTLSNMLTERTRERIDKNLLPVRILDPKDPLPEEGWLMEAELLRINQGSRFLRTAIGFGAGGTKMETAVYVYDLARSKRQPILTFGTTGGSNAEPGVIANTDPISAGVSLALGVMKGLSEDATRTARMIAGELSDYMFKNGFISKDQVLPVKRHGEVGGIVPL